jgi:hypothetical protein
MIDRFFFSRFGIFPWRCHRCGVKVRLRIREEHHSRPQQIWMG